MTLGSYLKEIEERLAKATPGWRSGRPDMQSFTGDTGIPFKSLYNDRIENEFSEGKSLLEAGRIYGSNSVNDSQLFVHSRTDLETLVAMVKCALFFGSTMRTACAEFANQNDSARLLMEQMDDFLTKLNRLASGDGDGSV